MKKISVILPVFNQYGYFKRCIRSVQDQSYNNIEILCVDDGSTDGVQNYLDEVSSGDGRIQVFHKKHSGESSARNVALNYATGDYITFVDCDDWIEPDMYTSLVNILESEDVDMVASGWFRDEGGKTIAVSNAKPVSEDVFGRTQLLEYLYVRDSYRAFAYMWNKIYKRELLEESGVLRKFDETLKTGGDVLYLAQVAINVRRAKYLDQAFYHYTIREGSGSHSKDLSRMRDWIQAYEKVIDLYEAHSVDGKIIAYIKRFMAYHCSNAAEMAIEQNEDVYKKEFQELMKEHKKDYIRLNAKFPERIDRYKRIMSA